MLLQDGGVRVQVVWATGNCGVQNSEGKEMCGGYSRTSLIKFSTYSETGPHEISTCVQIYFITHVTVGQIAMSGFGSK